MTSAVVTLPKIIRAMAPSRAMPTRLSFKPGTRPIAIPRYVPAKMARMTGFSWKPAVAVAIRPVMMAVLF